MVKAKVFEIVGNITLQEVTRDVFPNSSYEKFKTTLGIDILNDKYSKKIGFSNIEDIWKTNNILCIKDLLVRYTSKSRPEVNEVMNLDLGTDVIKDEILTVECTLVSSIVFYDGKSYCLNGMDLEIVMDKFKKMTKDKGVSDDINVLVPEKYSEYIKEYIDQPNADMSIAMLCLCSGLIGNVEEGDPRFFIVTCDYKELDL